MSNLGKLTLGRPTHAASAMGAKSTMPKAMATAYPTTMASRTGTVPTMPPRPEKITAASRVMAATMAPCGLKTDAPAASVPMKAMFAAVAESPTPMTTMTEATSTGGSRRSSQPVPTNLMMPATTRNTAPATITPDMAASSPCVAPTAMMGLMKANELPK